MVGGLGIVADPVQQLRIALQFRARRDLLARDLLQGRCRHQFPSLADRGEETHAVMLAREEIEADRRRLGGIS